MSALAVSAAAEAGDLRRVDDDVIGLLGRVGVRAGGIGRCFGTGLFADRSRWRTSSASFSR